MCAKTEERCIPYYIICARRKDGVNGQGWGKPAMGIAGREFLPGWGKSFSGRGRNLQKGMGGNGDKKKEF